MKIPPESVMYPGRGVSLKGSFYSRWVNGKLVVSKWPRPQPLARTKAEAANRELLAKAARFTKYMSPGAQAFASDLAKKSKLLPRDFLLIALFNRVGYVVTIEGRKIYSMPSVIDVSGLIDALGQVKGDILVRGPELWDRLPIGEPLQVLTVGADGELVWSSGGGGGGGLTVFSPPFAKPTGLTANFGGDAWGGIPTFLPAGTTIKGMKLWVNGQSGGHDVRSGLYLTNPATNNLSGGTLAGESATQTLTLGLNVLPFITPHVVPADAWYYFGPGFVGAGNVYLADLGYQAPGAFFFPVTFPLPATAPGSFDGASANGSQWLF